MTYLLHGFLIGFLSLIPGISSGTALLLLNEFTKISHELSLITKGKWHQINCFLLLKLIMGSLLGIIIGANMVEWLFTYYQTPTLLLFCSLIVIMSMNLYKHEFNISKINKSFFVFGGIIIILLKILQPTQNYIITDFPTISILFLLVFACFGLIDGFISFLPGISGSLVMMIMGPYFLYKSYLANISIHNILPISAYLIGSIIGILICARVINKLMEKYHFQLMSLFLGFILTSIIILLPSTIKINFINVFAVISPFILKKLNLHKFSFFVF